VAAASGWTPAAVAGIMDLWDQQSGPAGRPEIVAVAAEHLGALPSGSQPALARSLIAMIAKLPVAADRCNAFAKVGFQPRSSPSNATV